MPTCGAVWNCDLLHMHHTFRSFCITFNSFCLHTGTGAQDLSVYQNTESHYHDKYVSSLDPAANDSLSNSSSVLVKPSCIILHLLLPKGIQGADYSDLLMYTVSRFCVLTLRL